MTIRCLFPWAAATALLALASGAAHAVAVDGKLDAGYTLLSTQTTQTDPVPDASTGAIDFATGSELDAAWGVVDTGVLYLFLAGNLKDTVCGFEACSDVDPLELFIDSQAGGQNQLLGNSPAGLPTAGLRFDPGFAPDHQFEFFAAGALDHAFTRNAFYASLPSGGGGTSTFLGMGSNPGAPGTLSGATNPLGIEATIDNSNTAGVSAGCGSASGSGVTTGVEFAIPLAAIGNPTGCLKICAFVFSHDRNGLGNQVLGPLPPGTCALGAASGVDFSSQPGSQYFTLCFGPTAARRSTWGAVKSSYR